MNAQAVNIFSCSKLAGNLKSINATFFAVRNSKKIEEILADNWRGFGRWIVEQREAQGLKQIRLAEIMGMTQQQLSRLENGGSTKRATVLRLANALNVPHEVALKQAGLQVFPSDKTTEIADEDMAVLFSQYKELKDLTPAEQQAELRAVLQMVRTEIQRRLREARAAKRKQKLD